MDFKRALNTVWIELISNGIGWIAGLLAADLVSLFFIKKKWSNLWGAFSKKNAVDADTYGALEWIVAALIGFAVLIIVNKILVPRLLNPVLVKLRKRKNEQKDIEE
jgi:hypothetical protein